jgi:hypothetical protein
MPSQLPSIKFRKANIQLSDHDRLSASARSAAISEFGAKQTCPRVLTMSAVEGRADIDHLRLNACF